MFQVAYRFVCLIGLYVSNIWLYIKDILMNLMVLPNLRHDSFSDLYVS